jgi:hypothetical protein
MVFTVFLPDIMLIDGKKFHNSTSYVDKHTTLRTIAGSTWFTQFEPLRFRAIQIFHQLIPIS